MTTTPSPATAATSSSCGSTRTTATPVEHRAPLLDTWIAAGDVPTFSVGIAAHDAARSAGRRSRKPTARSYVSKREGRARIAVA